MQIPTNHISSQNGIILRLLDGQSVSPFRHLHRDDYYGFCLLKKGKIRASIDFQEEVISEHTVGCMLPGQVHQFIEMTDAHGFILFVDGVLLGEENIRVMNKYALRQTLLPIDTQREEELSSLFGILVKRLENPSAHDFARAIIDIFAEIISENDTTEKLNPHHREVFLRFAEILDKHIINNRLPKFYSDRLNITTGYLNEIITACVGIPTNQYIQKEIILRAKRELAYSSESPQEIAWRLGFTDYAYFSRLFKKSTGISPREFRAKYHE